MKNKERALHLLDQIINCEEKKDLEHRKKSASKMDYAEASGESFTLSHLKVLREMISEND